MQHNNLTKLTGISPLPSVLQIGQRLVVASKADLQSAEAAARQPGYLVMDATDWKVSMLAPANCLTLCPRKFCWRLQSNHIQQRRLAACLAA